MMRPAFVLRAARRELRAGNVAAAAELVDAVVTQARATDSNEARADMAHLLASYFRDVGSQPECEAYAFEAVAAERAAGREVQLANHLMFLVSVLSAQDRHAEVHGLAVEGLALYRSTHGAEHGETHMWRAS